MGDSSPTLSEMLKELTGRARGAGTVRQSTGHGKDGSGEPIMFKHILRYRKLYMELKTVVGPEPCPLYSPLRRRCKIEELGGGPYCISTKPYNAVLATLREAGYAEREARELIDKFARLGWIKICNPVISYADKASIALGIIGALAGLATGGLVGAALLAILGALVGNALPPTERLGEKRVIFLE